MNSNSGVEAEGGGYGRLDGFLMLKEPSEAFS
jgi:hypothetical protein